MPGNDYHFITHWQVQGAIDEVTKIMEDADDLVRWWPAVYLDVKTLKEGDEKGLGKEVSLYTKGWLPYTLRWNFRVSEVGKNTFTIVAWGDFEGRGIWTFEQDGPWVNVTYDWKISAEKPLLRYFSLIMKPIFSANHRWAMAKGEESLRLELARRRAATSANQAIIAAPPPATAIPAAPLAVRVIVLASVAGAVWLLLRAGRRKA
ncbi:MAG: hypothetical protein WCD86_26450 [Ktedonobacteraceae bacterium]